MRVLMKKANYHGEQVKKLLKMNRNKQKVQAKDRKLKQKTIFYLKFK